MSSGLGWDQRIHKYWRADLGCAYIPYWIFDEDFAHRENIFELLGAEGVVDQRTLSEQLSKVFHRHQPAAPFNSMTSKKFFEENATVSGNLPTTSGTANFKRKNKKIKHLNMNNNFKIN
jgi:hypothetical protein